MIKAEKLIDKSQGEIRKRLKEVNDDLMSAYDKAASSYGEKYKKSYKNAKFKITIKDIEPELAPGYALGEKAGKKQVKIGRVKMVGDVLFSMDLWKEIKKVKKPDKLSLDNAFLKVTLQCPQLILTEIASNKPLNTKLFLAVRKEIAPLVDDLGKLLKTLDSLAGEGNQIAYRVYAAVFERESKKILQQITTSVPPAVEKEWASYASSKPVLKLLPFKATCTAGTGPVKGSVKFVPATPEKIAGSLSSLDSNFRSVAAAAYSAEEYQAEIMKTIKDVIAKYELNLKGKLDLDGYFFDAKAVSVPMNKQVVANKKLEKLINDVGKEQKSLAKEIANEIDNVKKLMQVQAHNKRPLSTLLSLCEKAQTALTQLGKNVKEAEDAHALNAGVLAAFAANNVEWHKGYVLKAKGIQLADSLKAASSAASEASGFAAKKIPKPQKA